jgi:hypothetical protein
MTGELNRTWTVDEDMEVDLLDDEQLPPKQQPQQQQHNNEKNKDSNQNKPVNNFNNTISLNHSSSSSSSSSTFDKQFETQFFSLSPTLCANRSDEELFKINFQKTVYEFDHFFDRLDSLDINSYDLMSEKIDDLM